jgi:hypothetical protein
MKKLKLNNYYVREEIHAIFSPDTDFSSGKGDWGGRGYASIPNRKGDYVFMASYGAKSKNIIFKERINEDGTFDWQSQKHQCLHHKVVRDWINHDENENKIYYFYNDGETVGKIKKYKYLGLLKYLHHDQSKEQPVNFQWQLINWEQSKKKVIKRKNVKKGILRIGEVPTLLKNLKKKNLNKKNSSSRKNRDFSKQDEKNTSLGKLGELLVLRHEEKELITINHDFDKNPLIHQSDKESESPYDIKSYDENGGIKYIEVKTTEGSRSTDFFMSSGERKFASENIDNYYIYRVWQYDKNTDEGECFIINGSSMERILDFIPINYQLRLKRK